MRNLRLPPDELVYALAKEEAFLVKEGSYNMLEHCSVSSGANASIR